MGIAIVAAGMGLLSSLSWGGSSGFVGGRASQLPQPRDEPSRLPVAPLRAGPNYATNFRPAVEIKGVTKLPWIHPTLLNRITAMNKEGIKETVQTYKRSSVVIPAMIGHTIAVHTGREFIPLTIQEGMVGYALKDFVPSKTSNPAAKPKKPTAYRRKVKRGGDMYQR